jgi:uncharacterized membrane protein YadS
VGASAKYGAQALAIGTTVKLARALWIVPVSLLTAFWIARQAKSASGGEAVGEASAKPKIQLPWFILLFCVAAALNTYLPSFGALYSVLNHLGKSGLTATLFLIGTGLSKRTLRQVGVKPLVQGVALWAVVAGLSLFVIYRGIIAI